MSIGLKSDSSGTSGSIVINGSDAVLVTPTGITTASIQDSSITTAKIADGNITFAKLSASATEADNVAKRTAKAWVNFNGTGTVAIRDDFNVSSITDNGTGDYTVNFSTSLANVNYLAIPYASRGGSNANREAQEVTRGTSSYQLTTKIYTGNPLTPGAVEDMDYIHVAIFGS
jgi:hypothetical protein